MLLNNVLVYKVNFIPKSSSIRSTTFPRSILILISTTIR